MVFVQAAKNFSGFLHGVGGVHCHELRGHQAASGVFLVSQQLANFCGVIDAHQAKQRFGFLIGQVAYDVGGVVRVHIAQQTGCALFVQALDDVGLKFVFHF